MFANIYIVQMPPVLTLTSSMAIQCGWLKEVLARVNIYLAVKAADDYEFVKSILVPLIIRVLDASAGSETDWEPFRSVILNEAHEMYDSLQVLISFCGISGPDLFTQAAADGSQISVQASWAAVADNARVLSTKTSYLTSAYNYQVAFGVLKILRELGNCWTPSILALDYKLQVMRVAEPTKLRATSIPIDCFYLQEEMGRPTKALSDMGVELEALATQAGRMSADCSAFFEINGVHVLVVKSETVKKPQNTHLVRAAVRDGDAWAERVATSSAPCMKDFVLQLLPAKSAKRMHAQTLEQSDDPDSDGVAEVDLWPRDGLIEKVGRNTKKNKT